MKILYIHQHFSTPTGSTGTRSYEFAKRLVAAGHQVTMLCGSNAMASTGVLGAFVKGRREGVVDDIHVIELDLKYTNYDNFVKRALKFFQFSLKTLWVSLRFKYDLVFTTSTPLTVAIPGVAAKWLRRKPFVFEVRDLWPELPKAMGVITNPVLLMLMGLLERVAYFSADAGVGLSPGICRGMERYSSLKKVALIPNGCDLELFSSNTDEVLPVGLSDILKNNFCAVFTGAHGMANGLDAALDAAIELKRQNINTIKLVFVGDGKMKPHLLQRVKSESLGEICYFFDPISKKKIAQVLQLASVGLMLLANVDAFYYGTSPNKFFDYLAAGLPVLNNYPGWVAELIEKADCGEVVPPMDPAAFADALLRLSSLSADALKEKGANARVLAEAEFNRDQLASQFVAVINQVAR